MSDLALNESQRASLRRAFRRRLTMLALGGETWQHSRLNGTGLGTPRTPTTLGTINAAVYQDKSLTERAAAAGTLVSVPVWKLVVFDSTQIHINDILVSVADATLKYTVLGPDSQLLFPTYFVKISQ